ncbi:hypothetical protein I5G80_gp062 [Mycobacterium phage Krueger]|uniref:Uncharacterized protein n=1 Tax=Mycobacterium phage Krueger TaxID=2015820 RepID=A0A222ZMQ7_9CAUD|nr:hypothetical protein I5G80_gp062 [Mycobacterium phage Krueger]ASR85582.1 hypothetical protein SEA_KRUEGER_84 [Mycobacterium phage Krueger]
MLTHIQLLCLDTYMTATTTSTKGATMQNLTARNLAGVAWVENGRRAEFANASRMWGVTDGAGRWLSFDGVAPYSPRGGRSTAIEVADTIVLGDDDDMVHWIEAL